MSRKLREKLQTERSEYWKTADDLLAKQERGEDLTDGEHTTLTEARAAGDALTPRIEELATYEESRLAAARREQEINGAYADVRESAAAREPEQTSFGAQFVESAQFAEYRERKAGTSGLVVSKFNIIGSIDVASRPLAGTTKLPDAPMPFRATPLLDACMPQQVGTNEYEWVEFPVTVPTAGDVAEKAAKPEASIAPVVRRGTLGKAAHHIGVSAEALEDVVGLQSRIDTELSDGVRQKAEQKALAALVAATLPTATHDTLMKAIRVGVATVQMAGFTPTSVVLNPLDYAEIDIELLALTLRGAMANSPVWNLTIIPAGVVPQGIAYTGDIYRGMRKVYRSEVQTKITDSHAGEFIENVYRILTEQRLSVHVVRPEAIAECSANATP